MAKSLKILVASCSLNSSSKSRILARATEIRLKERGAKVDYLDLQETSLPDCDGDNAYDDPAVKALEKRCKAADAFVVAVPIYCYDVNSAARNLISLVGGAWEGKLVGMLAAAGGANSYMSGMPFANSLMLDFRCHILPRYVYAQGKAFMGLKVVDEKIKARLDEFADDMVRVGKALHL